MAFEGPKNEDFIEEGEEKVLPKKITSEMRLTLVGLGYDGEELNTMSVEEALGILEDKEEEQAPEVINEEATVPEVVPEPTPEIVPEPEDDEYVARIPLFITRQMGEDLEKAGWTEEQINSMTPAEAHRILEDIKEEQVPKEESAEKTDINEETEEKEGVFRLSPEELNSIEGFENLSEGQKLLVLENLKQVTLGRIGEDAGLKYRRDISSSRIMKRLWKGMTKTYQMGKLEKQSLEDIMGGGIEAHREVLEQLTRGMAEMGPDVDIKEDGSLEIQYIKLKEKDSSGNSPLIENIKDFNETANAYARIPYEWGLDTATKNQRQEKQETEERYLESRRAMVNSMESITSGSQSDIAMLQNSIDHKISMNRFLTSHPDVDDELDKIQNSNLWTKALKTTLTERGTYFGLGFAARSISASMLGAVALPFVAAGSGAILARHRAQKNFVENEKLSRRGIEDKSETARNVLQADKATKKIDRLLSLLDVEKNKEADDIDGAKIYMLLRLLETRVHFTTLKLEEGEIDFGSNNESLVKQLNLVQVLGEAEMHKESLSDFKDDKFDRLSRYLMMKEEKIDSARSRETRKAMMKGALIGAGFATAGWATRGVFSEIFGWGNKEPSLEVLKEVNDIDMTGSADIPSDRPITSEELREILSETPTETPSETSTDMIIEEISKSGQEERIIGSVEKGGSLWKTAKSLVENGDISQEDFAKAWSNPESVFELDGEPVHISELGLVHEEDQIVFIPGENGGTPHFEILQESKWDIGDNYDLAEAFEKEGKELPNWLKEFIEPESSTAEVVTENIQAPLETSPIEPILVDAEISPAVEATQETLVEKVTETSKEVAEELSFSENMSISDSVNQIINNPDKFGIDSSKLTNSSSWALEGMKNMVGELNELKTAEDAEWFIRNHTGGFESEYFFPTKGNLRTFNAYNVTWRHRIYTPDDSKIVILSAKIMKKTIQSLHDQFGAVDYGDRSGETIFNERLKALDSIIDRTTKKMSYAARKSAEALFKNR